MKTSKACKFTTLRSKTSATSSGFLPIEMLIFLMSVSGADGLIGELPIDGEP